ncbi:hypothetical protein [Prescottella sp. R16]|uniref:hypothetical protein n=1 Tax=Prescottella sp. R16 TaxID=3064529 RepID=UPI00272EC450|nr:hypothetical protein [Prescottella sp. R16]
MGALEYWFGTGDGEITTWSSVADVDVTDDGVFDAVRLDFDGDGLLDDVMWDSDGDGRADRVVLDLDGAGERWFADPDGRGVWAREVDQAPAPPIPPQQAPPPEPSVWRSVDSDGDGRDDTILVAGDDPARMSMRLSDTDGDGRLDTVLGEP